MIPASESAEAKAARLAIMGYSRDVHRGERIAVQVLDEKTVQTVTHEEPYVVISIVSPNNYNPPIPESPFRRGVLEMQFHDDWHARTLSQEQARAIADFVKTAYDGGVRLFVVHCEAGISRSSAVAKAIWEDFEKPSPWFDQNFFPNPLVYDAMRAAFRATFSNSN